MSSFACDFELDEAGFDYDFLRFSCESSLLLG
jgi:hypothetical protein